MAKKDPIYPDKKEHFTEALHPRLVNELLTLLNKEAGFTFWKANDYDIQGIAPVTVTTTTTIGENSFNPHNRIQKETFVKFFCIDICSEKEVKAKPLRIVEKEMELSKKHIKYIRNYDISIIIELVKKHN